MVIKTRLAPGRSRVEALAMFTAENQSAKAARKIPSVSHANGGDAMIIIASAIKAVMFRRREIQDRCWLKDKNTEGRSSAAPA